MLFRSAGNIVVDVLVRPVEGMPPWGTTTMVESIGQHLGGNGANTSYALGKLGARVRLAGSVGDDALGEFALRRLGAAGVDVSEVRVLSGVETASTVGLINGKGERLFLHALGASGEVEPEQLQLEKAASEGFSHFHFASVFNLPKMRAAGPAILERARRAGLKTSADTMWDASGRWMEDFAAFCPRLDCLFLNQDEARMLAGTAEPGTVGRFFRECGVVMVVLKMGERGCFVAAPGEEFTEPAVKATVVDTTGAGDVFCGAFLAGLGRGYELREAAGFANQVAARVVGKVGATEGLAG